MNEERFGSLARVYGSDELKKLQNAHVCVIGIGGVGSWAVESLARTGIGSFHLADHDTFEPVNINRQYGARLNHFNKPKLNVMINEVFNINPYLEIKPFPKGIHKANLDEFLDGVQGERETTNTVMHRDHNFR